MNRHAFLRTVFATMAVAPAAPLAFAATWLQPARRVLIQQLPVGGFQHHAGESVWRRMRRGDALMLVREPENKYDKRAVAVYWHRRKLGYVPRVENAAVAQILDRDEQLAARIMRLERSGNPWDRIRFEVVLDG